MAFAARRQDSPSPNSARAYPTRLMPFLMALLQSFALLRFIPFINISATSGRVNSDEKVYPLRSISLTWVPLKITRSVLECGHVFIAEASSSNYD